MSYRDDVEALFQRARTLQAEVDRLRDELAARPGAAASVERATPPPAPPPEVSSPPPRVRNPKVLANAIVADFTRTLGRTAWLPDVAAVAPRPRVAGGRNDLLDGVLVARVTEVEYALLMQVLELLADDDFAPAAVARNQAAFDQLAAELRERLAGPA
mgnify:CR=1 FL=1